MKRFFAIFLIPLLTVSCVVHHYNYFRLNKQIYTKNDDLIITPIIYCGSNYFNIELTFILNFLEENYFKLEELEIKNMRLYSSKNIIVDSLLINHEEIKHTGELYFFQILDENNFSKDQLGLDRVVYKTINFYDFTIPNSVNDFRMDFDLIYNNHISTMKLNLKRIQKDRFTLWTGV
jgi:hypothetical protein